MTIDGKADAGTGEDIGTQLILGHLPLLLHPNPEDVLVIGLGSGITLGAVEQHPEVKTIDAVEIEPAVVEAARYFNKYNNRALEDPRLNLIVGDARNYTLLSDKKYDVITAEPSNPWVAGSANLFTKEQLELYKKRLKPGGIVFQWAHIYRLSPEDVKTIMATFQEVFPHTTVWQSFFGRDIFLIGSPEPLKIDFAAFQEKMARKKIKKDLARVHLDNSFLLLSYSVLDEKGAKDYSKGGQIHTDNHPVLEFQAPKAIFLDPAKTESANLEALEQARTNVFSLLDDIGDASKEEKIAFYTLARTHIMQGEIYFSRGEHYRKGAQEYEKALAIIPDNVQASQHLAEIFFGAGKIYFSQGLYQEAEDVLLEAIGWDLSQPTFYKALAETRIKLGDGGGAIEAYERVLEVEPDDVSAHLQLGILYGEKGVLDRAEQEFLQILELDKENYFAHNNLANIYELAGYRGKTIEELEASLGINPDQPEIVRRLKDLKGR